MGNIRFSPASRIILIESDLYRGDFDIRQQSFSPASRIILIERN